MKILVVDDLEIQLAVVKRALKKLGYNNILLADDGESAIKALKDDANIKLVLCDWFMSKVDGIDVIRFMRSEQRHKETPFIMVTAESDKKNLIDAVKVGANDYLIKPIKPLLLKEIIEKIFQ